MHGGKYAKADKPRGLYAKQSVLLFVTSTGQCYDADVAEENVVHPLLERELELVQAVYGQNALETRYTYCDFFNGTDGYTYVYM